MIEELFQSWQSHYPHPLNAREKIAWAEEGKKLLSSWQNAERHYHALPHLFSMVQEFNRQNHQGNFHNAPAVYFAIWYHDAIYIPQNNDNEEMSANWAAETLKIFNFDKALIQSIFDLIMVTKTHNGTTDDEKQMIDIDLMILGAEWEAFYRYEQGIKAEYSYVPEPLYKEGRKHILKSFLNRKTIYNHADYLNRFEKQARLNIQRSINLLDSNR